MNIKVSKNETREFYGNELSNGIKFLNIKDINLDKTTVVVTVNIGSLADTLEFQGLAHFLEHMLFLGSNKYPNDNEFSKFISDNGGFTNAFTANTQTTYYFSIFNESLEKALDMFSQFFKSPLFNVDSVDREINAVHSEHTKNIMDDSWRLDYFKDIISRQGSIVNRFKTGNLSSLQKEGLRDKMIQFYNNYYIPSNISIVTVSSLENETTSSMISNIFSNIESKDNNNITITKPLYNSGIESFFLKSIRDKNTLMYLFEIPLINDNYNSTHSPWIISSIFTSINKKSLKQFLTNSGLIKDLYCYVNDEGVFIIQIELSEISNWQTVDSYIKFYVNNLKHQNWHEITEYSKKKDILFFNYSSKEDTLNLALNISSNLFKYPIEKVILGSQVVETIDLGQIEELVNNYLTFDNVKIVLSSNSIPNLDNIHFGEIMTEEFYNLKYYPINLDFLDEQSFEFEIITNNEFINTKPEVIKGLDSKTEPNLIKINNSKIWFGNLSKFNEAIVISELIFTNLDLISEMSRYIDTSILLQYIVSKFKEELYLASEIGFNTSLGIDSYNSQVMISISGYNDNFNLYFNSAIEFIKNFTYNPNDNLLITSIIKENIDHYKNINKKVHGNI